MRNKPASLLIVSLGMGDAWLAGLVKRGEAV